MGKPSQNTPEGRARQSSMDKQVNVEGHKAMEAHAEAQRQAAQAGQASQGSSGKQK